MWAEGRNDSGARTKRLAAGGGGKRLWGEDETTRGGGGGGGGGKRLWGEDEMTRGGGRNDSGARTKRLWARKTTHGGGGGRNDSGARTKRLWGKDETTHGGGGLAAGAKRLGRGTKRPSDETTRGRIDYNSLGLMIYHAGRCWHTVIWQPGALSLTILPSWDKHVLHKFSNILTSYPAI